MVARVAGGGPGPASGASVVTTSWGGDQSGEASRFGLVIFRPVNRPSGWRCGWVWPTIRIRTGWGHRRDDEEEEELAEQCNFGLSASPAIFKPSRWSRFFLRGGRRSRLCALLPKATAIFGRQRVPETHFCPPLGPRGSQFLSFSAPCVCARATPRVCVLCVCLCTTVCVCVCVGSKSEQR